MCICPTSSAVSRLCIVRNRSLASPDKVRAVRDYYVPKNVKDIREFLGLALFYRKLVPDFAKLAKALTVLTRKFTWGPKQQEAYIGLKERLCTSPTLAFKNFKLPFTLTTDASRTAIAAVLSQVQDGVEKKIGYASRQLNNAEISYTTSERELLTIVWATRHFRCYVIGKRFFIRTDHSALPYL